MRSEGEEPAPFTQAIFLRIRSNFSVDVNWAFYINYFQKNIFFIDEINDKTCMNWLTIKY